MPPSKEETLFLKRLGARLREIRLQKGWTLEETEEHGWTSWRHLQRMESGKNVNIVTLWRLAEVYSVAISELLKGL